MTVKDLTPLKELFQDSIEGIDHEAPPGADLATEPLRPSYSRRKANRADYDDETYESMEGYADERPSRPSRQSLNRKDLMPLKALVHPKEGLYFGLVAGIGVIVYVLSLLTIYNAVILVGVGFALYITHGLFIGHLKGNAVKLTSEQFPELLDITRQLALRMGLSQMPDVYMLQQDGALNAMATRFSGRDFVVLYADVMELAYTQGVEAVTFILAHELAHIQRGHLSLTKQILTLPGRFVPFLGTAYERACEYTCDRMGAYLQPDGAVDGLILLAAGKHLYRYVDITAFLASAQRDRGFWTWLAEKLSSHPHLSNRIAALTGFNQRLLSRSV